MWWTNTQCSIITVQYGNLASSESELARFPYCTYCHQFTNLVILQAHIDQHYSGVNSILTVIRQHYWIPSGRRCVWSILQKCKTAGKPYTIPDPPPLLKCHINKAQPFEVTGVDFTDSLNVCEMEQKLYIRLFTCAISRTFHLEVVDLSMVCLISRMPSTDFPVGDHTKTNVIRQCLHLLAPLNELFTCSATLKFANAVAKLPLTILHI